MQELQDKNLGKLGRDKITKFEGIIIAKIIFLFGCNQYGIAPQTFDKERGTRSNTEYFDEGRIEIVGDGIQAKEVQASKPGSDFNTDLPIL